jgi:hypothetical protein
MRINRIRLRGQAGLLFILLLAGTCLLSCNIKKEEAPVAPPETSPLSQPHIGFGVINVSYTNVNTDPGEPGNSLGYLRRGSVVLVHERRPVKNGGKTESWLLVEGTFKGWLKETLVDVYENKLKAQTASESMSK